jgi:ATP-dependent protease Clp ATPase subunit
VAGPAVYICEKCVDAAGAVIATGQAAETALGPLRSVPGDMTQQRCSFCGKRRHQVIGLAAGAGVPAGKPPGDPAICAECVALCHEIHAEQLA